jgi:hypothetical protein
MERKNKGSRDFEAYCKGGQDPPRAVAPPKKKLNMINWFNFYNMLVCVEELSQLKFSNIMAMYLVGDRHISDINEY